MSHARLVEVLVEIWLPYGSSEIPARIPEERLVDILRPNKVMSISDPVAEATKLIESNGHLQSLAREAERICVVLGPCSSKELAVNSAKILLDSLGKSPGTYRTVLLTPEAVELDPNTFPDTQILRHSPTSSPTVPINSYKGDLPVQLNSEFANANLRIVIGEVTPHHLLKYSGLPDIVFPELASENSARSHLSNRSNFTLPELQKERVEIARSVRNTFAMGLVLDVDLDPAQFFLGTIPDCMTNLEVSLEKVFSKEVTKPADIVVMGVGGAPSDESLLRAMETFPAGLVGLKRNGVLIVAAECGKGHGDTEFYDWCAEQKEPRYLEARLRNRFNYNGFKASLLGRILQTHRVYLISTIPDSYVENIFGMKAARTVNAALQTAQRTQGSDSTISVIPDATRVVPRLKETTK